MRETRNARHNSIREFFIAYPLLYHTGNFSIGIAIPRWIFKFRLVLLLLSLRSKYMCVTIEILVAYEFNPFSLLRYTNQYIKIYHDIFILLIKMI